MPDSSVKMHIVCGIAILIVGLFINAYGISGFPNSPAEDWFVYFWLGVGVIVLGIGISLSALFKWNSQRHTSPG